MGRHGDFDKEILNIIQSSEVREQEELKNRLAQRGLAVPQATISRHLKRLKIAKVDGVYRATELATRATVIPPVLNIQVSEFGSIVIHTTPGGAQALAYTIDQRFVTYNPEQPKNSGILGTIAGDDTILLIIKDRRSFDEVIQLLRKEFPFVNIG